MNISPFTVVRENLPFPVVHYPGHYGMFFAFAKDESSTPVLCACSTQSVTSYIQLRPRLWPTSSFDDPLDRATLRQGDFPSAIAAQPLAPSPLPMDSVVFVEGLCHRCNLATPSLLYCHPMYGTRFIQTYGWYVRQAYLRLGIYPSPFPSSMKYLQEVCPSELHELIEAARQAQSEFRREFERLYAIASGPKRPDIQDDEVTYWRNVRQDDAAHMIGLRKRASQTHRILTKRIEDIVRQEFGFRKVGEGWISETILYNIVSRIFPNEYIIRHYRPEWLDGLELDIYLPSQRIAFEYQGQQHYHPIRIWGGEAGLVQLQARDRRKMERCEELGIKLIQVKYTVPLTESHLRVTVDQVLSSE